MSDRLNHVVQRSATPFLILVVLGILGGVGYHFMNKKSVDSQEKLANELFDIKKEYKVASEKLQKTLPPADPKKMAAPPKPKKEDSKKEYAPVVEKLSAFVKANQGQSLAVEAGLLAAEMLSSYEEWVTGAEVLKTSLQGYNDKNSFLYGVAHSELGTFYVMQDKCDEAVQAWEKSVSVTQTAFLKPQLRLKLGVCYEKTNQWDRAEKNYQDVINDTPKSLAARTAKKFLFNLKLVKAKATLSSQND